MSNLHAEEYEIYEGKNLVAQTYGGPLYQHCNDKSYGEAVMLAKKMAACEDMYEALDNLLSRMGSDKDCKHWFIDEQAAAILALRKARGEA